MYALFDRRFGGTVLEAPCYRKIITIPSINKFIAFCKTSSKTLRIFGDTIRMNHIFDKDKLCLRDPKVGRSFALCSQQVFTIAHNFWKCGPWITSGGDKRSPFLTKLFTSESLRFSYGCKPYVKASHMVTPKAQTSLLVDHFIFRRTSGGTHRVGMVAPSYVYVPSTDIPKSETLTCTAFGLDASKDITSTLRNAKSR